MLSPVGTHDFRAFANRIEHTNREYQERNFDFSTIKTVNWIQFVDEGDDYYRVDVNVESALYRMVRNIVGSSLHVATGQMSIEKLSYLLKEAPTRRENKAKSAPPEGLTLEEVYYDESLYSFCAPPLSKGLEYWYITHGLVLWQLSAPISY